MASVLLAEDSDLADLLERELQSKYDVKVARSGQAAFGVIDESDGFDLCIVDIIMPVESPDLDLLAANETGLRLLEHIVEDGKCRRFLILTVVWHIAERVADILGNENRHEILLKDESDLPKITGAVERLLT